MPKLEYLRYRLEQLCHSGHRKFFSFSENSSDTKNKWTIPLLETANGKEYRIMHSSPFCSLKLDGCYNHDFTKVIKDVRKYHVNQKCDYILITENELIFTELKSMVTEKPTNIQDGFYQVYVSQFHGKHLLDILGYVLRENCSLELGDEIFPSNYHYCILYKFPTMKPNLERVFKITEIQKKFKDSYQTVINTADNIYEISQMIQNGK